MGTMKADLQVRQTALKDGDEASPYRELMLRLRNAPVHYESGDADDLTEEESEGINIITSFLSSMAERKSPSLNHDLELIQKIAGIISEAADEKVLNPREVAILLKFFADRFVRHRVNRIVQKTFEPKSHHWQCSFRHFKTATQ